MIGLCCCCYWLLDQSSRLGRGAGEQLGMETVEPLGTGCRQAAGGENHWLVLLLLAVVSVKPLGMEAVEPLGMDEGRLATAGCCCFVLLFLLVVGSVRPPGMDAVEPLGVEAVEPLGVAVVVECTHFCMVMRGVQKVGASTVTSSVRGCFEANSKTRAEFFSIIQGNGPKMC